jgi:hypothetical protein
MRAACEDRMSPNASSGVPVSQARYSASLVSSAGLRSWLMVLVSAFGSGVMKENTSNSTLSRFTPFFSRPSWGLQVTLFLPVRQRGIPLR